MALHVAGLGSTLDLGALADALVLSNTPAIQDRINSLPPMADPGPSNSDPNQLHDGSNSMRTNDRGSRKSARVEDYRELHRLWKDEGRETDDLRRILKLTNDRLATEREQTLQLEQRLKDVRLREATARVARRRAENEAAKSAAEARAYKLHLDIANFENSKAQEQVNNLALERREAESAAARARSTAHKLREKLVRERALQEGRSQGMADGLRIGYDEGVNEGFAEGHDEGFSDMRDRAFHVWDRALRNGAINPSADFDLDRAIRSERKKITSRGPSRRASARESLRHAHSGHSRSKSTPYTYRAQITSSEDLSSIAASPRRVPVPQFSAEQPPMFDELGQPGIQVTVTSPPESIINPSPRSPSPSPRPFARPPSPHHAPVEPMYEGTIPVLDENGRIRLPPPHDINPSPLSQHVPLPGESYSQSQTQSRPASMLAPRSRKSSLNAPPPAPLPINGDAAAPAPPPEPPAPAEEPRHEIRSQPSQATLRALEAAKVQERLLEEERAKQERARIEMEAENKRLRDELMQERQVYLADIRLREEQETARARQRQLEKEAELARQAERQHEREQELNRQAIIQQELDLERARSSERHAEAARLAEQVEQGRRDMEKREREREAERKAERAAALERELQRQREQEAIEDRRRMEEEAAIIIAAEREEKRAREKAAAERAAAEKAIQDQLARDAAIAAAVAAERAEAANRAALERFQAEQVAALRGERDLPKPPLAVRNPGESEEDEDFTTDDNVPYENGRPPQRRRKPRSVYSAKTGKTGMSTPLSQFTLLDQGGPEDPDPNAPTKSQRRENVARHRDSTLARERQNAAGNRQQPFMPSIPEAASQTNGDMSERMVTRTPHASLPTLPITLDQRYPDPVMRVEEESVSLMDKNGNYVGPTYDNLPPVLPVPAPAGGPLGAPGRSPFVQNVHRYDSARSPSPTPSARGGKPVSPIPNIVVERASVEELQEAPKGQGPAGILDPRVQPPRSILKKTPNLNSSEQPVIPIIPGQSDPASSSNIRLAKQSPHYTAANPDQKEGVIPGGEDFFPQTRIPMQRPGYRVPKQKTADETFGAIPERPAGRAVGGKTAAELAKNQASSPADYSPPGVSPGAAGRSPYGQTGHSPNGVIPTQTPRTRLMRPVGAQPAAFEVQPGESMEPPLSARTPKTPYAPTTPHRMQRPLGAPAVEAVIVPGPSAPIYPTTSMPPRTPRMQRPSGAPTGAIEFGQLPPEEPLAITVAPAQPPKQPMRRPGMNAAPPPVVADPWGGGGMGGGMGGMNMGMGMGPQIDAYPMMSAPAPPVFPTPGISLGGRALAGPPKPSNASEQPVVLPLDNGSVSDGRPPWGRSPSTKARPLADVKAAATVPDTWGKKKNVLSSKSKFSETPTEPVFPDTSHIVVSPPAAPVVNPTPVATKTKGSKHARKLSSAAAAPITPAPPPVSNLARAESPAVGSPNSKPVAIPIATQSKLARSASSSKAPLPISNLAGTFDSPATAIGAVIPNHPTTPRLNIIAPSPSGTPPDPWSGDVAPVVQTISIGGGSTFPHVAQVASSAQDAVFPTYSAAPITTSYTPAVSAVVPTSTVSPVSPSMRPIDAPPLPGSWVSPASPTKTARSVKATLEEVTDEERPPKSPWVSNKAKLHQSSPRERTTTTPTWGAASAVGGSTKSPAWGMGSAARSTKASPLATGWGSAAAKRREEEEEEERKRKEAEDDKPPEPVDLWAAQDDAPGSGSVFNTFAGGVSSVFGNTGVGSVFGTAAAGVASAFGASGDDKEEEKRASPPVIPAGVEVEPPKPAVVEPEPEESAFMSSAAKKKAAKATKKKGKK